MTAWRGEHFNPSRKTDEGKSNLLVAMHVDQEYAQRCNVDMRILQTVMLSVSAKWLI